MPKIFYIVLVIMVILIGHTISFGHQCEADLRANRLRIENLNNLLETREHYAKEKSKTDLQAAIADNERLSVQLNSLRESCAATAAPAVPAPKDTAVGARGSWEGDPFAAIGTTVKECDETRRALIFMLNATGAAEHIAEEY